jgi:hypothetical protein
MKNQQVIFVCPFISHAGRLLCAPLGSIGKRGGAGVSFACGAASFSRSNTRPPIQGGAAHPQAHPQADSEA